jgi:hypothetical protein
MGDRFPVGAVDLGITAFSPTYGDLEDADRAEAIPRAIELPPR